MGEIPQLVLKNLSAAPGLALASASSRSGDMMPVRTEAIWPMAGGKARSRCRVWLVEFCTSPARGTEQLIPDLSWGQAVKVSPSPGLRACIASYCFVNPGLCFK